MDNSNSSPGGIAMDVVQAADAPIEPVDAPEPVEPAPEPAEPAAEPIEPVVEPEAPKYPPNASQEEIRILKAHDQRMERFIGMDKFKKYARDLVCKALWEQRLAAAGNEEAAAALKADTLPNVLFVGSPGVGKTEAAKELHRTLHEVGYLNEECVATTPQTLNGTGGNNIVNDVLTQAQGGMLIIDEAYQLKRSPATNTALVAAMTDPKLGHNVMIVAAGYLNGIDEWISTNAGFRRRFPRRVMFDNYTAPELVEIGSKWFAKKKIVDLTDEARVKLQACAEFIVGCGENCGNAGSMDNFARAALDHAEVRAFKTGEDISSRVTISDLDMDLALADLKSMQAEQAEKLKKKEERLREWAALAAPDVERCTGPCTAENLDVSTTRTRAMLQSYFWRNFEVGDHDQSEGKWFDLVEKSEGHATTLAHLTEEAPTGDATVAMIQKFSVEQFYADLLCAGKSAREGSYSHGNANAGPVPLLPKPFEHSMPTAPVPADYKPNHKGGPATKKKNGLRGIKKRRSPLTFAQLKAWAADNPGAITA